MYNFEYYSPQSPEESLKLNAFYWAERNNWPVVLEYLEAGKRQSLLNTSWRDHAGFSLIDYAVFSNNPEILNQVAPYFTQTSPLRRTVDYLISQKNEEMLISLFKNNLLQPHSKYRDENNNKTHTVIGLVENNEWVDGLKITRYYATLLLAEKKNWQNVFDNVRKGYALFIPLKEFPNTLIHYAFQQKNKKIFLELLQFDKPVSTLYQQVISNLELFSFYLECIGINLFKNQEENILPPPEVERGIAFLNTNNDPIHHPSKECSSLSGEKKAPSRPKKI